MFWITQDASSGSDIQYLAKITHNGSIVQLLQALAVLWRHATVTLPTPVILAQLNHYLQF
jgi:hypothetical protein